MSRTKRERAFLMNMFGGGAGATAPTITSAAPALPVYNVAYTHTFTATGTAPITWTVTAGALPTGLSLVEATGVLSGTPTTSEYFTYTVTATNAGGTDTESASGVIALLREEFTSDAAINNGDSLNAEPGPGALKYVEVDGVLAKSSGKLTFTAQTTANWGDEGFYHDTGFTRVAGLALLSSVNLSTRDNGFIGWGTNKLLAVNSFEDAFYLATTFQMQGTMINGSEALTADTEYPIAIILRGTGAYYYVKVLNVWTLFWVSDTTSTATLYPYLTTYQMVGALAHFHVWKLGAPFSTDDGNATQAVASPVSGTDYAGVADGIFKLTVTAPDPMVDSSELRFRVQDATNYWTAYYAADGSFNVDSVASGTPTSRIAVAGVMAAGGTRSIALSVRGTLLDAWTKSGTTWTKRGGQVNLNYLTTQTTVKPIAGVGSTIANLKVFARTASVAAATELDKL